MRIFSIITDGIAASLLFLALFTCQPPTNPFNASEAKVGLILTSSFGQVSNSSITDTVGNTVTIGLVLYLTQHIDSTRLEVKSGSTIEKSELCTEKVRQVDTIYHTIAFSSAGSRTVTAKGYVKGELSPFASATIHIVARPQENRKPELTMSGTSVVVAGETVRLIASYSDPDTGQTVTVQSARLPDGATFASDTFLWATTLADVGTDTAVFVAYDNGEPVMSDTETVIITVSATPVNRPPEWNPQTIPLSGQPGVPITLTLADKCTDPDGDIVTYSLLGGTPDNDTVVDSTWSFTPAASDTGEYAVFIVACDPSDASDTLTINLTIAADDNTKPVMHYITPDRDSLVVSSSSYQITVSCTDESGIALVKCEMGTDTFTVTQSNDTLYSATVTGLTVSQWNTIRLIATDAAPAANSCTLAVYLKYDATIPDNVPPVITLLSPSTDTLIGVDSCTIRVRCTDDSGVALVSMNVGSDTVRASRGSDNTFTATVKGLIPGQNSTVTITAVDSSAARNSKSVSVRIKYDNDMDGPVMTPVSPAKDSISINASSYDITISCTDPSGVASVNGTVGSQSFTGTRGTGNNWSISISGLVANTVNTVVITATDSSLRANTSSISFYITYDSTIGDNVPPTLYLTSPVRDTVIGVDSFMVTAVCKDQSGIASLAGWRDNTPFTMNRSTTVDSVWTGTVKELPAGAFAIIKLIATDASTAQNSKSVSVRIKYDNDVAGPTITKITPTGDSVTTNASDYTVTLQCTDASGVLSVNGVMGTSDFAGARGSGNSWTIAITGLTVNAYNTVVFTATDSSLRANTATMTLYIEYDPTMDDVDGPTIKQISGPASGAIVLSAAIEIIDSVVDPSGIDSVFWTKNGGARKTMSPVSGNAGQYSLKDTLAEGNIDTLMVTAVDKATRHNRSTQTFYLRYVRAPAITVPPVSQAVCSGAQAIFSITATGTAPLSYQWRTGATSPSNITGAIFPRCTLNNVTSTTILSCVVSNTTSVTSNLCTLTVNTRSTAAESITTSASSVCSGDSVTLTVSGGSLGTNASWNWYTNAACTSPAGTGASISPTITSATTYYVRAEGDCDTTGTVSKAIALSTSSSAATSITASPSTSVCPDGQSSVTLTVHGGSLGTGASWKWYTDASCTNPAGTGNQIYVTTPQTYYVLAEGLCNITPTVNITITETPLTIIPNPDYGNTCTDTLLSVATSCTTDSIKWYFNPFGIEGDDRLITSTVSEFTIMPGEHTLRCNTPAGSDIFCIVKDRVGRIDTSGTWKWGSGYCQ